MSKTTRPTLPCGYCGDPCAVDANGSWWHLESMKKRPKKEYRHFGAPSASMLTQAWLVLARKAARHG